VSEVGGRRSGATRRIRSPTQAGPSDCTATTSREVESSTRRWCQHHKHGRRPRTQAWADTSSDNSRAHGRDRSSSYPGLRRAGRPRRLQQGGGIGHVRRPGGPIRRCGNLGALKTVFSPVAVARRLEQSAERSAADLARSFVPPPRFLAWTTPPALSPRNQERSWPAFPGRTTLSWVSPEID
jgi:hypothetical protein